MPDHPRQNLVRLSASADSNERIGWKVRPVAKNSIKILTSSVIGQSVLQKNKIKIAKKLAKQRLLTLGSPGWPL
ncbi:MAG: hypothetical protein C0507_05225 [Cyanobacteria bacterium PR.3.49]|nr:hypothetical protein [Cyanobacteria bacterium PR.3.49]